MMRPKTLRDWNQTKSWEMMTMTFSLLYYPPAMHYYYYHKKGGKLLIIINKKPIKSFIPITLFFSFEKALKHNWDHSDQIMTFNGILMRVINADWKTWHMYSFVHSSDSKTNILHSHKSGSSLFKISLVYVNIAQWVR